MKKWCRQCERDVRRADYYRHPRTADGLLAVCKSCHRANVKANREANADRYREYERGRANLPHRLEARAAYLQTPEGRQRSNEAKRRFTARYPFKKKASEMVNNAVRDGKIQRQPCEKCGNPKAQAHHDDYSKPLDVRWLCTAHHAEWHRHNEPKCPPQDQAAA